jgi:hypothetical protein
MIARIISDTARIESDPDFAKGSGQFLRDIVGRSMSCAAPVKKCSNGMAPALVLWTSGATHTFQRIT